MAQSASPADAAPASRPAPSGVRNIGVIGIDSSHFPEFSRRINERFAADQTPVRVTRFWTDGRHDMSDADVSTWRDKAQAQGVEPAESLGAMLDAVDGVMVLTLAGEKHLPQALPALERGLPTYIDKPLACSAQDARQILAAAEKHGTPCYSASSLRFASEANEIDRAALGELAAVDAYGPGELHDKVPGLFFYGVHTIEMVDAIWGPGVQRVACRSFEDRDLIDLLYHDGRLARLRLERKGAYDFGATVHGSGGIASFKVDFATVYDRLVDGLVRFFEKHEAPVELERIVENIAVVEAAHASRQQGGVWVELGRAD